MHFQPPSQHPHTIFCLFVLKWIGLQNWHRKYIIMKLFLPISIYFSERTQTPHKNEIEQPDKPGGSPSCSDGSYVISKHLNNSLFECSTSIFNVLHAKM